MLDLISAYENYLSKVKKASANTVASYMRDIRQFSVWKKNYQKHLTLSINVSARQYQQEHLFFRELSRFLIQA